MFLSRSWNSIGLYGQMKEGEKPISIGSRALVPEGADRGSTSGYKMRRIDGCFRFLMKG